MNTVNNIEAPIRDISNFIGRKNLATKVYSRIGAGRPQSVSLVGDYKIGKTSFLNYLVHPAIQDKFFDQPQDYHCFFLPVRDACNSLDEFVKALCSAIAERINCEFNFETPLSSYDWFKRIVETMSKRNKKFILFMDDFNLITQNEAFPLEFFSFMRSLANNYNVAYVTTSYLDLQQLCVSKDVEESPFFNIFTNITVKAFDETETSQFMSHASSRYAIDFEKHQDLLIKYAGHFPYLLEVACDQLKKSVNGQEGSLEKTFAQNFKASTEHYFKNIWDNLSEDARSILVKVAHRNKIGDSSLYLLQELVQKQLILTNKSKNTIFSPAFHDMIYENGPAQKSPFNMSFLLQKIGATIKGLFK